MFAVSENVSIYIVIFILIPRNQFRCSSTFVEIFIHILKPGRQALAVPGRVVIWNEQLCGLASEGRWRYKQYMNHKTVQEKKKDSVCFSWPLTDLLLRQDHSTCEWHINCIHNFHNIAEEWSHLHASEFLSLLVAEFTLCLETTAILSA
jgi:hypothetical protein